VADDGGDGLEVGDDDGGRDGGGDGDGDRVLALDPHRRGGWRMPRRRWIMRVVEGARVVVVVRVSRDWWMMVFGVVFVARYMFE
jgi:hypothetical protein